MKAAWKQLQLYATGELNARESQLVEKALESDPELRRMLEDIKEQEAILDSVPTEAPRRDLVRAALESAESATSTVVWLPRAIGLAAVVLLLLGALIWIRPDHSPGQQAVAQSKPADVVASEKVDAQIAHVRSRVSDMRERPSSPGLAFAGSAEGGCSPGFVRGSQLPAGSLFEPKAGSRRHVREIRKRLGTLRADLERLEPHPDQTSEVKGRRLV